MKEMIFADGAAALAPSAGRDALSVFALLLAALALLLLIAELLKKRTPCAIFGAGLVVVADQYVKRLTVTALAQNETAPLLPGWFCLSRVHNYGAAWSSLSGARWLLIGVTAVGLGLLSYLALRAVRHPLGVWALWLVIGGGIGNLIDRVRLGYVVDMFAAEFIRFPVFNVADIFVTGGTVAAAVYYCKYHGSGDAETQGEQGNGTDSSDGGRR